ncbi:MAG: glycosyltransferase family 4 protein, partial [Candidatus Omnitrophota bacterium]
MKICFIAPSFHWVGGGSETIVYWFARILQKRHEVSVLCGKPFMDRQPLHTGTTPFRRIEAFSFSRDAMLVKLLAKCFRMELYDVESRLFFHIAAASGSIRQHLKQMDVVSVHYAMDSLLFSSLLRQWGVPTVFHLPGVRRPHFFEQDHASFYVANSLFTKAMIESRYSSRLDGVVTPGISPLLFGKFPEDEGAVHHKRILYVGRLSPEKGISHLPDIFEGVVARHPDAVLTVVGDGPERRRLESRLLEKGLSEKVVLTGQLGYEELVTYYHQADLYIHCSNKESFGMTVLEAMAAGLPVIASDLPIIRQVT